MHLVVLPPLHVLWGSCEDLDLAPAPLHSPRGDVYFLYRAHVAVIVVRRGLGPADPLRLLQPEHLLRLLGQGGVEVPICPLVEPRLHVSLDVGIEKAEEASHNLLDWPLGLHG